jgi:hypothetical protein
MGQEEIKVLLISELPLPSLGKGYPSQPLHKYLPQLDFQVIAFVPLASDEKPLPMNVRISIM